MPTLRSLAPLALVLAAAVAQAETKKDAAVKPVADRAKASAPAEKGRDWSQIDTNKDGHVSPDEMEKWLAANPGPLKK